MDLFEFFRAQPIITMIALTLVTAIGDIYLKNSSSLDHPFRSLPFYFGLLVYSLTAFFWVIVYKDNKFSTVGSVYSVVTLLLFVVIGVVIFKETLSVSEYLGIALAFISFYLLARFL